MEEQLALYRIQASDLRCSGHDLALHRVRSLPGTAVRKGKKKLQSVREKDLFLAQLVNG